MIMLATMSVSVLAGCSSSKHATTTTEPSTSTTAPEALWVGQGRAWVGRHSADLKAISTWAKNLGDAAKGGNAQLVQTAATQFLIAVGQADDDLPDNAFGHDLHGVFVDYAAALALVRKGLINGDSARYRAGITALAAAVDKFGLISNRLKASR
jgi:hypothetical protein